MSALSSLVSDAEIIVTAGSGGVGKTTTAAVLALEGARSGRRGRRERGECQPERQAGRR